MPYVVNVSGFGSFGADCHAATLRKSLGEVWPSTDIILGRVDGVPFFPETQDGVVLGGGGLLFDHIHSNGESNLKHFLRYPAVMQAFDKSTFGLCLGVQGHLEPRAVAPYLEVLNRMRLLTVRDTRSAEILRGVGVSTPVIQSADLSYLLKLPDRTRAEHSDKPILGIAVSQPHKGIIYEESHGFEGRVLAALNTLDREFNIRFYSFDRRNEGAIADDWPGPHSRAFYDAASPNAVERFTQAIGESDLFLTSRLHGVILPARMGIPFVAIGAPGEKVDREAHALKSEACLPYSSDSNAISEAIRAAWSNRERTAGPLQRAVARHEARARVTIEELCARA